MNSAVNIHVLILVSDPPFSVSIFHFIFYKVLFVNNILQKHKFIHRIYIYILCISVFRNALQNASLEGILYRKVSPWLSVNTLVIYGRKSVLILFIRTFLLILNKKESIKVKTATTTTTIKSNKNKFHKDDKNYVH